MSNGHTGTAAWILSNLARLSQDAGALDRAAALYRESLMMYRELGGVISSSPESLEGLALVAHAQGSHRRAACLIAAATAIREQTGIAVQPVQTEPVVAATRQALGDLDVRAAWHAGSTMTLDDAIAFALEPIVADASPASDRRSFPEDLTVREVEVLRLIAAGHSNRQIAYTLFLSPRTIERHIANIYLKIDVHSKAEATEYARCRQLA